jgi:hypothetical protein
MRQVASVVMSLTIICASASSVTAQCPNVGRANGCNSIITVTDAGVSVTLTGQGPYDGDDDTLVGIKNNSKLAITTLGLRSQLNIFAFDGDGLISFGITGNSHDGTGYGGPNAYFTDISPDFTSGIVHFIVPIAPNGGTGYFALENALTAATSCSSIINNAVTHTASGPNISATFTPNLNLTIARAAKYCGFKNFDWVQQVTHQNDPSEFYARNLKGAFDSKINGGVRLTSARTPYSDPPPGGGYLNTSADFSYPFYYNAQSGELQQHEPTQFLLTFHDRPEDHCLPGGPDAGGPKCDFKTEPAGSYGGFVTHLAGVNSDGTATDLGIGFTWTSTYNGMNGNVATKKTGQAGGPGSGTGGVAVTSVTDVTDYQFSGLTVTSINGSSCVPDATTLCLNNGRFAVSATFNAGTQAHVVQLTPDTGYLWFFSASNAEAVVKVINGCALDSHFWVFAGGLTNVSTRITVTDTITGRVKTYLNPANTPFQPIQDTGAFATCTAADATTSAMSEPGASAEAWTRRLAGETAATARALSFRSLRLNNNRFQVDVTWQTSDGKSGAGMPVPLTGDTGYFWFFNSSNVELLVKVLNGCALGGRYWVFAGGLTDVDTVITVTDTATGASKRYNNPQGTPFQPLQDTSAFATCP